MIICTCFALGTDSRVRSNRPVMPSSATTTRFSASRSQTRATLFPCRCTSTTRAPAYQERDSMPCRMISSRPIQICSIVAPTTAACNCRRTTSASGSSGIAILHAPGSASRSTPEPDNRQHAVADRPVARTLCGFYTGETAFNCPSSESRLCPNSTSNSFKTDSAMPPAPSAKRAGSASTADP